MRVACRHLCQIKELKFVDSLVHLIKLLRSCICLSEQHFIGVFMLTILNQNSKQYKACHRIHYKLPLKCKKHNTENKKPLYQLEHPQN